MSTDYTLPRATTRTRTKRRPDGNPPSNTWWKLALVAVASVGVFVVTAAAGQPVIAATLMLVASWEAQRAWRAWPWYRDGYRPTPMPSKPFAVVDSVFVLFTAGWAVIELLAFILNPAPLPAAWTAYFAAWVPVAVEDWHRHNPGGWLRGRRKDGGR